MFWTLPIVPACNCMYSFMRDSRDLFIWGHRYCISIKCIVLYYNSLILFHCLKSNDLWMIIYCKWTEWFNNAISYQTRYHIKSKNKLLSGKNEAIVNYRFYSFCLSAVLCSSSIETLSWNRKKNPVLSKYSFVELLQPWRTKLRPQVDIGL